MDYDVIIIGAGPAGYVAAIRAGQVGLKTALIENKYMGGMCLNWGCISTKTLLESAKVFDKIKHADEFGIDGIFEHNISFNWEKVKERSKSISGKLTSGISFLLKKNGVDVIYGQAKINNRKSITVNDQHIEAGNIIIATGSKPLAMDQSFANAPVVDVENLFSIDSIPKNIAVTGNHISSVELSQFFKLIGRKVTLVTNSEHFLQGLDNHLIEFIKNKLETEGIELLANKAERYENGHLHAGNKKIECELIVNCNSRKACLPETETPFELTEAGFIKTDNHFETSLDGVFAIGDVTGKSFLALTASAQGIHVVNYLKGIKADFDTTHFPINVYTNPEISQVGMTEQAIIDAGIDYKVSKFSLSANGKALIEGNTEGFFRMLSHKKYGQVLGVQIVSANATDMIAEANALMSVEGSIYDIAKTIHAHPTISEIFMETGFDTIGN
ncbi:MAG TPA: dihydrolipoyl dehydrogenase [Paludibacter sp.]|nr:dihydrolipoyl dehydrogenase [Paludibacter sp.]